MTLPRMYVQYVKGLECEVKEQREVEDCGRLVESDLGTEYVLLGTA